MLQEWRERKIVVSSGREIWIFLILETSKLLNDT